tara:strand:+ start:163 stop:318 length:156 start_codon:yes stop_codon:yes gene_type:complete
MKHSLDHLKELRAKAESSLNKTAQFQQVIAQVEASLLRKENQKVKEKSKEN